MFPLRILVAILLAAFLTLAILIPVNSTAQSANCNLICNSDFENIQVSAPGTYHLVPQITSVPCWNTTEPDGLIEVWGTGFNGVPAYSGNQFIELNANVVATLYQTLTAIPGTTVNISWAHRGRLGPDVMSVSIGPVGGPYDTLGSYTADNTAWVYSTVPYTFPTGVGTNFVLQFNSISATGGNQAIGNFLDAISITLPTPTVALTATNACSNVNNGTAIATTSGGTAPFTYTWAPAQTNTDTVTNLAPAQYSVTITDAYGCTATNTTTVAATPVPTSTTLAVICANDIYTLPDGSTVNTAGQYVTHVPNANGCDSIVNTNLTVNPVPSTPVAASICHGSNYQLPDGSHVNTSGNYTNTLRTVAGCDSIIVTTLTVIAPPVTPVSAVICYGTSYTLPSGTVINQSGNYIDTLVTAGGCDSVVITSLAITPPPVTPVAAAICYGTSYALPTGAIINQSGTYIDTLVTAGGCDSVVITTLTVTPPPVTAQFDSICPAQSFTRPSGIVVSAAGVYIDTLVTTGGCDSVVITNLTVNPVSATTVYDTICTGTSFTLQNGTTVNLPGTYPVTLSNRFGCDSVVTTALTVITLNLQADSVDVRCHGQSTGSIIATCTGGVAPYSFWMPSNGMGPIYNLTGVFSGFPANTYMVYAKDTFGCTASVAVTINQQPAMSTTVAAVNITCPGYHNGQVTLSATGGTPGYNFMLDGQTNSTGQFTMLDTGNYHYYITDNNGCPDSGAVAITQPSPILITLQPDSLYVNLGKSIQLNVTSNFDPNAAYLWNPTNGLSCYTCPAPIVNISNTTSYNVQVTANINGNSCSTDTGITITVIPNYDLFIPNAFTPNGNGINDFFEIYGNLQAIKFITVQVFDRIGEKVFESSDVNFKWDGTYKGKLLSPQVLVYTLRAVFDNDHTDKLLRGSLTLLR